MMQHFVVAVAAENQSQGHGKRDHKVAVAPSNTDQATHAMRSSAATEVAEVWTHRAAVQSGSKLLKQTMHWSWPFAVRP